MDELTDGVGGTIHLAFSHNPSGECFTIQLAVAPFAATPTGAAGDFPYTGAGLTSPTESGVLATYSALAAVLAPYWEPDWFISLAFVKQWRGDGNYLLPDGPSAPVVQCTCQTPSPGPWRCVRYIYLYGSGTKKQEWTVYVRRIYSVRTEVTLPVTADSGGYDARDRAVLGYVSGPDTGIVARDGTRYQAGGQVRTWTEGTPLQLEYPGQYGD